MPRFFVDKNAVSGACAVLNGEAAAHCKVLRLKAGDAVTLCDGLGTDYFCHVQNIEAGSVSLQVEKAVPSSSEPKLACTVFMAFAKSDKLEHVIQKATELGAVKIVAYPSARCVSKPDEKGLSKKLERWQKIAAGAAEQSGRGVIPQVAAASSFAEACGMAAKAELSVLLYENEQHLSLRKAAEGEFSTAAFMTGPEGGFSPEEVAQAQEAGLQICTLGPRILRCETAPLCALAALMFAAGELD